MKNVKVILWGLGAMGGGIGKMLAKKKGVDIVGGIDIGDKIGKNLYDVRTAGAWTAHRTRRF